jgi:putative DNA primase/helicase
MRSLISGLGKGSEGMAAINLKLGNIPDELKARPQWVGWKYVQKDGRETKLPYNPKTGALAEADNPLTWGTIQEVLIATEKYGLPGIGFVFSQDDPFCGIDFDKCFDPDTGKLEAWAQRYVDLFKSYTEITPSGKGLHIIVKGKLPEREGKSGTGRRQGKLEVYDRERFFTFTGNLLNGNGGNRASTG